MRGKGIPAAFSLPFHKEVASSTAFAQRASGFLLLKFPEYEKLLSLQA